MIEVQYRGGNSVVITTKQQTLLVDANVASLGLKNPKVGTHIQLGTEKRFLIDGQQGLTFEGPGDYEVGNASIQGVAAQRHIDTADDRKMSTMYRITIDDITTAVIGNVDSALTEEQYEQIGIVDVLVVPVGGNGYTLDATAAAAIVRHVEPKVVIPVHYKDSGITYEVDQADAKGFIQELGSPVEEVDTLKLKSASALPPVLTVYLLKRQ